MPANLLLDPHPWLKRLFVRRPITLGLILAAPGVLLHLLAVLLGLHSIQGTGPNSATTNVGFLYQANWLLMIPIVIPGIFVGFSLLSIYLTKAIRDLEANGLVRARNTDPSVSFLDYLFCTLSRRTTSLLLVCLALALTISYLDTLDLTAGYRYEGKRAKTVDSPHAYPFDEEDWSVAFQAANWRKVTPSNRYTAPPRSANGVFVVFVYSAQGAAIFLGFFWVLNVAQFLLRFSACLRGPEAQFELMLRDDDPADTLGLSSLGRFYTGFLRILVVFQVYIFFHRLQQVALQGRVSLPTYLADLIRVFEEPKMLLQWDLYAFDTADEGQFLLLVAVFIPMAVICWFPLIRLRGYVEGRRSELALEYARRAETQEDAEEAAAYREKIARLDRANVWPNGDLRAYRYLALMGILLVGAWLPPVMAYLLSLGILSNIAASLRQSYFRRREAGRR